MSKMPTAQGEIGAPGIKIIGPAIGLIGRRTFAAFRQHMAKLDPDREILRLLVKKAAILLRSYPPMARVAGCVRLEKGASRRPPSPKSPRHANLATMLNDVTK
ncbi:MAG: hypothetical protein ABW128_01610 [Rhizorhabdus sp.]